MRAFRRGQGSGLITCLCLAALGRIAGAKAPGSDREGQERERRRKASLDFDAKWFRMLPMSVLVSVIALIANEASCRRVVVLEFERWYTTM